MLKKTESSDSWEMPWNRKLKKKRSLVVPQSQSGRNVDATCFLLCFVSILLLSSGLVLISLSIWSLIRKAPYFYLIDIKLDIPYFTLPAGILGIPSFWIAASIHNNKKSFRFLLLLIFLMILSTLLLITGSITGLTYSFQIDHNTTRLVTSMANEYLDTSVHSSFLNTNNSAVHKIAWDKTQWQLKCCGVVGYQDWLKNGMQIPGSCCNKERCDTNNVFLRGCLDALSRDLVWHKNILKAHSYIVILLQLVLAIMVITVYFLEKEKNSG